MNRGPDAAATFAPFTTVTNPGVVEDTRLDRRIVASPGSSATLAKVPPPLLLSRPLPVHWDIPSAPEPSA
jgi:hypothetical protein